MNIGFLLILGGEAINLLFVSCADALVPPYVDLLPLLVREVEISEMGEHKEGGRMLSDDCQTQVFGLVCATACKFSG